MKRISKLFLVIALALITTGCGNKYLKEINYKEYHKLLDNKQSFILEIMKTDCPYCEKLEPKLKEVANKYEIEIKVINTAHLSKKEVEKIYDETGISGTPTIIFYKDGVEETTASRINGNVSEEKLISKFKDNGIIEE